MDALWQKVALAATIAVISVPVPAMAGIVPPDNSAANQYTETFPTAGGGSSTEEKGGSTPAEALGVRNARRIEALGPDGKAAAALAAATAPAGNVARPGSSGKEAPRPGGDGMTSSSPVVSGSEVGSSSGLSEVLGQATGSSGSGQMGLLLPLVVAATIAWSVAYLWRRRRTT